MSGGIWVARGQEQTHDRLLRAVALSRARLGLDAPDGEVALDGREDLGVVGV